MNISGFSLDEEHSLKTQTVSDNGFNPTWGEEITFHLRVPEMDLLQLVVYNGSNFPSDHIGHCIIPVEALKDGYRALPLSDENDEILKVTDLLNDWSKPSFLVPNLSPSITASFPVHSSSSSQISQSPQSVSNSVNSSISVPSLFCFFTLHQIPIT